MPIEVTASLVGVVFGGFLTYFFSAKLSEKQASAAKCLAEREAKRIASAKFREAFREEISAIRYPSAEGVNDPYEILRAAFGKHRAAVFEYALFLTPDSAKAFSEAWHEYYAYDSIDTNGHDNLLKYSSGWVSKSKKDCRDHAISNLEKLLKFAKP